MTWPSSSGRSDLLSWLGQIRQHDYLPLSLSRSPSPPSSSSSGAGSPPLAHSFRSQLSEWQWHSTTFPNSLARRKLVQLVLTISIPLFAFLLVNELHSQRVQFAALGAELLARNVAGYPDTTGRVDLASWRSRQVNSSEVDIETETGFNDVSDLWPSWWGNVDEVGRSPFDYVPRLPDGKSRRILFLTDYTDYLERMNTHTYEIVDAALRLDNVIVDVWGPGWAGYEWDVPLSTNVKRRANRVAALEASREELEEKAYYDHLGRTKLPEDGEADATEPERPLIPPTWTDFDDSCSSEVRYDVVLTISDIYKPHQRAHLDALDCGALLVQQLGDCHQHGCLNDWYPYANNITLSKYAFELPELFNHDNVLKRYPGFHMGLFGHSPDTGNPWDFYPVPWKDRTAKAVVFGYDGSLYPIRTTVTDHLRALEENPSLPESPISRHPHPGYTVNTPDEFRQHPLETYTPGHETYSAHRALREDFARGLRTAQICIFDASVERKLIRKYAQALLSGCVVAADLATEHEEAMSKFVIKLHPQWKIERIEQELNEHLADPQRLHQMAMDGFAYARQHLTTTGKVMDVLRMADAHNAGARGYDHAFSFSSRCRSYFGDAPPPPWCVGQSFRGLEDQL